MFALKKIITSTILPPGIFIAALLIAAVFAKKRLRIAFVLIACILYGLSIPPAKNLLMAPLEDVYKQPPLTEVIKCDAYVVLGGGVIEDVPDIDGKGSLAGDSYARVLSAFRLYLAMPKPIVISGGNVHDRQTEAEIAKRLLLSLGVKEDHIIAEGRSRDTHDNARFTKELAERRNIQRIALITSAYHMKRSIMLFARHFKDITPYPVGYHTSRARYDFYAFLPSAGSMEDLSIALKERLGILFYSLAR